MDIREKPARSLRGATRNRALRHPSVKTSPPAGLLAGGAGARSRGFALRVLSGHALFTAMQRREGGDFLDATPLGFDDLLRPLIECLETAAGKTEEWFRGLGARNGSPREAAQPQCPQRLLDTYPDGGGQIAVAKRFPRSCRAENGGTTRQPG
jgi:hypothetical protein